MGVRKMGSLTLFCAKSAWTRGLRGTSPLWQQNGWHPSRLASISTDEPPLPSAPLPRLQHAFHLRQFEPFRAEQHQQVIDQVSRLAQQLVVAAGNARKRRLHPLLADLLRNALGALLEQSGGVAARGPVPLRSEEHTSELQSLMRISYAVFCLKKTNEKYR